jgi:hypothetical protein
MKKFSLIFALVFSLVVLPTYAGLADDLDDLVGYTIIASKTIDRWHDDHEKGDTSFNGCSHGRVIVFTDNTALTCAEYGYQYAYRPAAVILAKEITFHGKSFHDFKMIVEDEIYDMRR